jgi:hypothetical protein
LCLCLFICNGGFDTFNTDFDCVSTSGSGSSDERRANHFADLAHFVAKSFDVFSSGLQRFV